MAEISQGRLSAAWSRLDAGSTRAGIMVLVACSVSACSSDARPSTQRQTPETKAVVDEPAPVEGAPPTAEQPPAAERLPPLDHDLCHGGGWCWVSPRPHGNDLLDVVANSSTDIWAVGAWGTVMHYDGVVWTSESIGDVGLRRVWARAPDDVWVIGYQGFVAHRDAEGWQVLPTDTDAQLTDIDGVGDDVWILGEPNVALHWDGHVIRRDSSFPRESDLAIEVIAADDIWVGGGYLEHFDGQAWTRDPKLGLGSCTDIHAFTSDDLWCADERGRLFHRAGGRWSFALAGGSMVPFDGESDLARASAVEGVGRQEARFVGLAPDDLYVTISGQVSHWDGQRWTPLWTLPRSGRWIATATITDTRELFGVGARGRVIHGRDEPWAELSHGPGITMMQLFADPAGSLFAANILDHAFVEFDDGGVVQAEERLDLSEARPGSSGGSARARRIVQDRGWFSDSETIAVFDGKAWLSGPNPTGEADIQDAWAAGPQQAWAISNSSIDGHTGARSASILQWDGVEWKTSERVDGGHLFAVDGLDADHVWVGGSGGLMQWDGARWTKLPEPPVHPRYGFEIVGIEALALDDLWVADDGAVHHFDGTSWTTDKIGFRVLSLAVTGNRVWVSGHGGLLVKTL